MRSRPVWLAAVAVIGVAGCGRPATAERADARAADSTAAPDSIPDERPDSVTLTPPDSVVLTLALLPPAPGLPLAGAAAELGERAVFVPRTQRWFMARPVDGALAMDIGRIDGGVSNAPAFEQMLAARSPVQPGMIVTRHDARGADTVTVTGLRLSGRRLLATLGDSTLTPASGIGEGAVLVEWRGAPPAPTAIGAPPPCAPGDTAAISGAIARYVPAATEAVTVLRGCFGDFRALITVRPLEITTESAERVLLVRATGRVRSGRLRDLSYPLHALQAVTDVDADGTNEIIVRSFRPAMETWAALRMTDSVTFTRFASGFTIEKR